MSGDGHPTGDGPLSSKEVKDTALASLASGQVEFTAHAQKEMADDGITEDEVREILRGGVVEPAEWRSNAWRYRMQITKAKGRKLISTYIVIEIEKEEDGTTTIVVTAWRKKR